MRNTDLQMEYKRDLVAMSNKSGVTGYGNQYLVNFNTDGTMLERVKKKAQAQNDVLLQTMHEANQARNAQYAKAHAELLEQIKKEKDQMIQHRVVNTMVQKTKSAKLDKLVEDCKVIEAQLEIVQNNLKSVEEKKMEASDNLNVAQKALEEANANFMKINQEHDMLAQQFEQKEAEIDAGGKMSSDNTSSSSSMHSNNRSVQDKNKLGQNETGKSWFGGLFSRAENELELENIARFSAPRENRCAYV